MGLYAEFTNVFFIYSYYTVNLYGYFTGRGRVIGYARRNIRPFDDLSLRTASRRAGEISAIVDKMLYYAARGEKR